MKMASAGSSIHWLNACQLLEQQGMSYCLATIVAEAGSAPRNCGAKMVITIQGQYDTLGGGNLEQQVIQKARTELERRHQSTTQEPAIAIERYSMAADLGQCCGGAVQVLFEYFNLHLPRVAIFGAGHVCQALAPILNKLQCHITITDPRYEWLESLGSQGIRTQCLSSAEEMIATLLPETHLVIMTHDHSLDYELTRLALEKKCFPYIGLIGSEGKKQRFTYRLQEQLSNPALVSQLTCPIGHPEIKGKLPMQVALSIAAQLSTLFEQGAAAQSGTTDNKSHTSHKKKQNLWRQASVLLQSSSAKDQ